MSALEESFKSEGNSLILVEGNFDCVKAEGMNTLIDDNNTLILCNGEKFKIDTSKTGIVFVCNTFARLSKAFVSRLTFVTE